MTTRYCKNGRQHGVLNAHVRALSPLQKAGGVDELTYRIRGAAAVLGGQVPRLCKMRISSRTAAQSGQAARTFMMTTLRARALAASGAGSPATSLFLERIGLWLLELQRDVCVEESRRLGTIRMARGEAVASFWLAKSSS